MNTLYQFSYKISLLSPIRQAELLDFLEYLLQKDKPNHLPTVKTLPTVSVWEDEDFAYLESVKNNDNIITTW